MGKKSNQPERLYRIVGKRSDGSVVILKGGLTAQEATAWFTRARSAEFVICTIESEQEWPPLNYPVNPPAPTPDGPSESN